ncbi:MAG: AAA family ATPase [Micromonosporaceae bacterium]|nr:AAA family ATPase [Micromonosporaceae bacterium]
MEVILSIGVRMLEISLLGPIEVRASGRIVSLSPLERNLLTVLALSKGTAMSTERIIDRLWGERHPAAPRSRVQGLVSAVRRKVGGALVTRHPGYLLEAGGIVVDLDECEDLARRARRAGSPGEVAGLLRQALRQWRGEPLDGVSAPGIETDRVRLVELRIGLLEQLFAAELALGHHAELVSELAAAAAANPLREELAGQLMRALYRSNRRADALRVYQDLRARLAEELGTDPCADLRELHATILRGEPVPPPPPRPSAAGPPEPVAGSPPPAPPGLPRQPLGPLAPPPRAPQPQPTPAGGPERAEVRPAQLPASVGHFTGRDSELAALTRAIRRPVDEPRVLLVSGPGGIGKTALVVQWARSIAGRYPDGQIFIDLHGRMPRESLPAGTALGLALGALGVTRREVPETADERSALFRTLLSRRQVLVIADDAAGLDQLLPLVPPTTASQLVATSRRRLAALAAHHAVQAFQVQPLSPQDTRNLLARIVGPHRLRESAAARVVQWCGGWPLATRLVGTKLAARHWQSMASFANELDDLADLVLDDDPRSVRAALLSAHESLSPAAAHLFARIGRHPSGQSLSYPTTAEPPIRQLRGLLDELVAVHLLVEVGHGRYHLHDVVRRFARQCGAELTDLDAVDEWVSHRGSPAPGATGRMARLAPDSHRI